MEAKPGKVRYNGTNYRPWKIALEAALRAAGLEDTITDVSVVANNNKAMNIVMAMMAEEKIVLLEDVRDVPSALLAVSNDRARESHAVRYKLQRELIGLNFDGKGKVKQYLDQLEDLVRQYRMAGGQYEDREVLSKITADLGESYLVVTLTFGNTTSFADAKVKLLETDDVMLSMPSKSTEEHQMLLASKVEAKEKSSEVEELRAELEALKLELKKRDQQPARFGGKCFNCNIAGHRAAECRRHVPSKADCKCAKCLNKATAQYQVSPMIANVITSDVRGKCVLDSGATDHFCDGNVALENFKATSSLTVSMANGQHSYVKGCGDYFNKDLGLKLKDVKAVNSLKQGLISVAKLTDCGYKIIFDRAGADILSGEKVLARVPRIGNLYAIASAAGEPPPESVQSLLAVTSSEVWHRRLGHTGTEKMKQLSTSVPGVGPLAGHCDACKKGKLKQGPFRRSDSRASRPLELVHMDLAGPHPVTGFDGSRYFVVFVDDCTRHIAVFLLKDRTQALLAFKLYRQKVESQCSGHRVKQLMSDQARELTSGEFTEYLVDNQINHRLSTPHSHQQNGVAERAIQSIRNIARTNLISGSVPERFWPEAVRIAAHQYNVVPHSTDAKSTVLAHAAACGMEVHHVDVKTAFLNSDVDRELYCSPPDGLKDGSKVWRLLKSLYGLRQAPHCWHKKLCQILKDDGFVQGKVDQCVFVRKTTEGETLVLVYVDDVLIASSSLALTKRFKDAFKSKVEIRDLGRIKQFIGLQVDYKADKKCYTVSQQKLIEDYFSEFKVQAFKPIRRLPEVEHMRPGIDWLSSAEQTKYRQLIGGLLYIANLTRPDVCFAVNYLSRFMQKATKVQLQNAEKVLLYLYSTKDRQLHLGGLDNQLLTCYSDASFRKDEKDQTGVYVTYKGSIVQWISRKQDNYNQSTTEAEYCALQLAADECLWLRQLLMDWGVEIKTPTMIYEDNKQVIKLVKNGQVHTRAKYLAVKLRALHDLIIKGHIAVDFIASRDQWADMLTKSQLPQDVNKLFSSVSLNAGRNRGECEQWIPPC
ncbi:hypothetical protein TYRP_000584 [Tyrophagus putrescentiae]|nr:hypothetical protein TYRP_000584 [Tyrophagus putrescentiae]